MYLTLLLGFKLRFKLSLANPIEQDSSGIIKKKIQNNLKMQNQFNSHYGVKSRNYQINKLVYFRS